MPKSETTPTPRRAARLLAALLLSTMPLLHAASVDLMPIPAKLAWTDGRLAVDGNFSVAIKNHDDAQLRGTLTRALRRWEERTLLTFHRTDTAEFVLATDASRAQLVIDCAAPAREIPMLGDDESYTLTVSAQQAVLSAPNTLGVLRGLETLLQLIQRDADGWFVPAGKIEDTPRFAWRGLMLDPCRHWMPMEVIKRNLDAMALVKLNVLHFHLTEDQGFRVESKTHPELHLKGSDGKFFTQEEIREIIRYAAERGIRVVPEFDMPGHATAWVVSHPELGSAPGPYVIERKWGIFDPVLDPTNEAVYKLLEDFLGEMAALFPDPYLHIGGDENNGKHWNANERIQQFIRDNDLKDNEGIHAYFNRRVRDILIKHGKKMVGWDEILHPDLPQDAIVHSWRGREGLAAATAAGHATILSNGYYIDLCFPASDHYHNDPIPADSALTPEQQKLVLGGEATMWAEWVTPETIDSRIWPRTAAIAERLWSPREVNDTRDMYRRLGYISRRLEEAGLNHERNRPAMIRRLAGDRATAEQIAALSLFIDLIEPVKEYHRGQHHHEHTQHTPLGRLADCARPESFVVREFSYRVGDFLSAPANARAELAADLEQQLTAWLDAAQVVTDFLKASPAELRAGAPVATNLHEVAGVGLAALDAINAGTKHPASWRTAQLATLEKAAHEHDALLLPMLGAIRELVNAAFAP